jgi:hypothetical protein
MKKFVYLLVLAILYNACSTDKESLISTESLLIGTWHVSELRVDANSSDAELLFAQGIVDQLVAKECEFLSLTFIPNGEVESRSGLNDVGVEINGTTDFTVDCPSSIETEISSWALNDNQLTIHKSNGQTEILDLEITETTLVIDAQQISSQNISGGELVFIK